VRGPTNVNRVWIPGELVVLSGHKRHQLHRHCHKGPHHVAVLVLEDVTVVHVPAAVVGEADGDLDDLVRVDADGVLEAALIVIDGVLKLILWVGFERYRRCELNILDTAFGDLVAHRAWHPPNRWIPPDRPG